MKRVSRMEDVAALAGVSKMTVSRVLHENPNVSAKTLQRVSAAITALSYQPNELARSFREQRTRQVGVILPYLLDPFFAICAHSVSLVAKQHGYSVAIATSNDNPQTELDEAVSMFRRNVEGLIVVPARTSRRSSRLAESFFEHLPIVAIDRPIKAPHIRSITVENEKGGLIGTDHLIRLGHRRIVYFGLGDEYYTMRMRQEGYTSAMKQAGLAPDVSHVSIKRDSVIRTVRTLMLRAKPPTALFCGNNLVTQHVLHGFKEMDMRIPDDIALVGFDDFESADLIGSGITVVRQPAARLGHVAAKVLFEHLRSDALSFSLQGNTVLSVELIVRGSCGSVTGRKTRNQSS